jgi:hypothetical protein
MKRHGLNRRRVYPNPNPKTIDSHRNSSLLVVARSLETNTIVVCRYF